MRINLEHKVALPVFAAIILASCRSNAGAHPTAQQPGTPKPQSSASPSPAPSLTPTSWIRYSPTSTPPAAVSLLPITSENAHNIEPLFTIPLPWPAYSEGLLEVSPDGKLLALAESRGPLTILPLPWQGEGEVIPGARLSSGRSYNFRTVSISFSPDGSKLAVVDDDDLVAIIDFRDAGRAAILAPIDWPTSAVFTEGGTKVAIGTKRGLNGSVQLWDLTTASHLRDISRDSPSGGVCSLAISPDESALAAGYCTYIFDIRTWDITADYSPLSRLTGLDEVPYCPHFCDENRNILRFNPATGYLASGTNEWRIPLYDVKSKALKFVLTTLRVTDGSESSQPYPVSGLVFSHDGDMLALSAGNELQLRDPGTGAFFWHHDLEPWEYSYTAIAITPDSRMLISTDSSPELQFWGIPAQ